MLCQIETESGLGIKAADRVKVWEEVWAKAWGKVWAKAWGKVWAKAWAKVWAKEKGGLATTVSARVLPEIVSARNAGRKYLIS
ncbi:Hypothetical protein DEACI_4118 [Acididesulfobacillus acetoxydans]|uniref:Uncharacterized protein n=1 Tax=Acididesulfobacillus acetoxydans TaxID=1561005 RepID=A0A8S0Y4V4_9FIRM|nr:Hypothetical protein DEACI_4118 [Acididesulfobacillus acetoxydans]